MKEENMKTRQDMLKIKTLMTLTLADRRSAIVEERWPIPQIKKEFPCLFNEDEVSVCQSARPVGYFWSRCKTKFTFILH